MPDPLRPPYDAHLTPIRDGAAFMEHRGDDTLIWPDDWWDSGDTAPARAVPLGVIPGHVGADMAEVWYAGRLAGREEGYREDRRQGFADCQAGLRALLGAASAADVGTLLDAAAVAKDG